MRDKVSVKEIANSVDGEILCEGEYDYVRWVVSSGLMSDVLTTEEEEILLVSSLTSPQVARTADMVGANAILIGCGKPVSDDTLKLAKSLDLTVIRTNLPVFEACCKMKDLFYGN